MQSPEQQPSLEEFLSSLPTKQRADAEAQIEGLKKQLLEQDKSQAGTPVIGQPLPERGHLSPGRPMTEVLVRNDKGQLTKQRIDPETAARVEQLKAQGYTMVQLGATMKQKKVKAKQAARDLQKVAPMCPADRARLKRMERARRVERKRERERRRQSRLKGGARA